MNDPTPEEREAISKFVHGTLTPLIEEVLTKKLSQAAIFLRTELRNAAPTAPQGGQPVGGIVGLLLGIECALTAWERGENIESAIGGKQRFMDEARKALAAAPRQPEGDRK